MDKKVGERIRKFRVIKRLSQEDVAEAIGMSTGNYGKIERGEISISIQHLHAISIALDMPMVDFIEEKKDLVLEPTQNPYVSRVEFQKLASDVQKLLKQLKK